MVVPFLIGQAAIVMLLTGSVLYNNANVLLINQVPVTYLIRLVLYFIPFLIHMTMPVAMAVAASLSVSRLGRDSEITVLRASGASLRRIFRVIFVTGLLLSVGDFYFGEYVVPPSIERLRAVLNEMITHLPRLAPQAGQYIISSDQSYAIFVRSMISRHGYVDLYGVQITASPKAIYNGTAKALLIQADRGRFQDGTWQLENASLINPSPDGRQWTEGRSSRVEIYISVDPQAFQSGFNLQLPMFSLVNSAEKTFTQLREELIRDRREHIHDPFALLDYHFKLSVPFSCLVMALCCPPLAFRFAKGGGFMGTLLSICLVFVYWNTLLLARILGSPLPESGVPLLPPPVAAWSQNVIFALLGLYVLKKSE